MQRKAASEETARAATFTNSSLQMGKKLVRFRETYRKSLTVWLRGRHLYAYIGGIHSDMNPVRVRTIQLQVQIRDPDRSDTTRNREHNSFTVLNNKKAPSPILIRRGDGAFLLFRMSLFSLRAQGRGILRTEGSCRHGL
jgi:hypothetical protein